MKRKLKDIGRKPDQKWLAGRREIIRKLEDCRAFVLRFDELDDSEISFAKSISDLLEKYN